MGYGTLFPALLQERKNVIDNVGNKSRPCTPLYSRDIKVTLHGKVAESTMLFEVALRAKLILEHLGEVAHIFSRCRLNGDNKLHKW